MKNSIFSKPITIAIVGPHYAGKSTLSKIFQKKYDFNIVEEKWWKDPFRDLNPRDWFRSQMWFLYQQASSILKAKELNKKGKNVLLDTFIYSGVIFAETVLDKTEFEVFYNLHSLIAPQLPTPDVVVYLHADIDFLYNTRRMQRVKAGTGPKEDIDTPYDWYKKVCELNKKYFEKWDKTNLLKIDVEKTDLMSDISTKAIIEDIKKLV